MQTINRSQTVSRDIRTGRFQKAQDEIQNQPLRGQAFAARRAQVAAIGAAIVLDGSPELHADSSALCSHFKLRKGLVGGEACEAQVYTHAAGIVIRFWVYPSDFSVRVRDLVLLPVSGEDKGWELWLDTTADGASGKLFPHDGGKYALAAHQILMNRRAGF